MIAMIEKRICDVCHKEVEYFSGSVVLDYTDIDFTGCGYPVKIERREICLICCRKLHDVLTETLKVM